MTRMAVVIGLMSLLMIGCGAATTDDGDSEAQALKVVHACTANSDCAVGKYCKLVACGDTGAPGTCTVEPRLCPDDYFPVCGCNGHTYTNACGAAAQGVSVRSSGACP
jgi:hypothetical protein